ncbi:MocR-like pyridoxine biosynthesis transcription factor PdxR [Dongia sp. agr-C8]
MARRRGKGSLVSLAIRLGTGEGGLSRQLYAAMRAAILEGRLGAGDRLPASRVLAADLGVSRNTALAAVDQLVSEGYLETRRGSGCYVARDLPDARPTPVPARNASATNAGFRLSKRGRGLAATPGSASATRGRWYPCFAPGVPDNSDFPFALWARLLARSWRHPANDLVQSGDPAGHPDLRKAVADYLRQARGVRCEAEHVLILSGIRQAVDLTCRLLLDPGDAVWMENPCHAGVRAAIAAAAVRIVDVPVDDDGLVVGRGIARAPKARLACVAPSHQYPLGVVLSLQRRLQLLAWAREASAWVLEDDYDSEFRYEGRPLATLQSLDAEGRVIYVGSLSKVLFPSLRIAYLVAPPALVEAFRQARAAIDETPPMTPQPALAAFFAEGHLAAHVRRQRKRYAERQARLLALAKRHLGGLLELAADPAGLHLVARPLGALARIPDTELAMRLNAAGIVAPALSSYYSGGRRQSGLLLGYAAVPDDLMEPALERMAEVLEV